MDTRKSKLISTYINGSESGLFKKAVLIAFVFFIFSIATLTGYGINWDTINHLPRGQAYLHYFLTGKRDYSDLPKYFDGWQKPGQWYWQDPDYLGVKTDLSNNSAPDRSLYQIDSMNFDYFLKTDGDGHPPLSDIISSAFNEVLFRRLKLVNDIDSYRVYGILMAAITVGLVFYWAGQTYGLIPGVVAALSISLYPLFWSESHFNTEKDIPETTYWSLFMFLFWKGITTKNWKLILLAGCVFGFALGTKLNILFAVFVIAPWFFIQLFRNGSLLQNIKSLLKGWKLILSLVLIPVIGLVILILTWPYLWRDPLNGVLKMVGFYKTIGTTNAVSASVFGLNLYPIKWILYTTPIVTLSLTALGILGYLFTYKKDKNGASLLFVLWFLTPILRVMMPGSNIYGGVRQIMEYIPGMALVSAIGFNYVSKFLSKKLSFLLAVIIFIPILFKIISIHPNENVYFNNLIGGLKGAKSQQVPYWGFSFGSPYRQAASWLNKNADKNSVVVYTFDLIPNLPRIWLRTDLDLYNGSRSGYLRQGEYAMGLTFSGTEGRSYYDMYLEKFIQPVYEVKVDDTAILKIWKNDVAHLKVDLKEHQLTNVSFKKDLKSIVFDLKSVQSLSRLELKYKDTLCKPLENGTVYLSENGREWAAIPGPLPDDWNIAVIGPQPKNGAFITPFVGQSARYVRLSLEPEGTCLMNVSSYKFFVF